MNCVINSFFSESMLETLLIGTLFGFGFGILITLAVFRRVKRNA